MCKSEVKTMEKKMLDLDNRLLKVEQIVFKECNYASQLSKVMIK